MVKQERSTVITKKSVQEALIKNIVGDLEQVKEETALRAVCNFYRADETLGQALANQLKLDISSYVQHADH